MTLAADLLGKTVCKTAVNDCCMVAKPCVWPCNVIGDGWLFILILATGATAYFGGGALYAHHVEGKTLATAGWQAMVPHRAKWIELGALVWDGVQYTRGRLHGSSDTGGPRAALLVDSKKKGSDSGGKAKRSSSQDSKKKGKQKQRDHDQTGASGDGGKRDSSPGKRPNESKGGKSGGTKSKKKGRENESVLTTSEGSPELDKATAAERLLREQVEQDERLHQSQAKIKVIGLNG